MRITDSKTIAIEALDKNMKSTAKLIYEPPNVGLHGAALHEMLHNQMAIMQALKELLEASE